MFEERSVRSPDFDIDAQSDARREGVVDLLVVALVGVVVLTLASIVDAFERFYLWSRSHESWQLDELATLSVVLMICFGLFSWRRWRALQREIRHHRLLQEEVTQLEKLLPVCSYCRRIRAEDESWQSLENYLVDTGATDFSHGICPTCYAQHVLPQLQAEQARQVG